MSKDDGWVLDLDVHGLAMVASRPETGELEISIGPSGDLGIDSPNGYVYVPLPVLRNLIMNAKKKRFITDDFELSHYHMQDNEDKFCDYLDAALVKINEMDTDIYQYVGLPDSFYDDTPENVQEAWNKLQASIGEVKKHIGRTQKEIIKAMKCKRQSQHG